jgi:mRNA degradation ribonuclease J1/J2
VTVKAFLVNHGDVPQAFGYRFETPDRAIVISGDAAPSQRNITPHHVRWRKSRRKRDPVY